MNEITIALLALLGGYIGGWLAAGWQFDYHLREMKVKARLDLLMTLYQEAVKRIYTVKGISGEVAEEHLDFLFKQGYKFSGWLVDDALGDTAVIIREAHNEEKRLIGKKIWKIGSYLICWIETKSGQK